MKMRNRVTVGILAIAAAAAPGLAGIVSPAVTSAAGPFTPGYLIVSPASGDPTLPAQTNQQPGAGVSVTQTIVTGASGFKLDRIDILSGGKAGGTGRLHIYASPVGGGEGDGFVNTSFSTDLLNGGNGLDLTFNGSGGTQILSIDPTGADEITLAPNTKYAIDINVLTGAFSWQRSNQSEYTGGNIYQGASELNFNGTGPANGRGERNQVGGSQLRDGLFAIYGTVAPEPASLSTLALAAAALVRRRRA